MGLGGSFSGGVGAMSEQSTNMIEQSQKLLKKDGGAPPALPMIAKRIQINVIYPDPVQPRRTIPSKVADFRDDEGRIATEFADIYDIWSWLAAQEANVEYPYNIEPHLFDNPEDMPEREVEPGPIESALIKLIGLARSIRDDGLQNPITVAKIDDRYVIETGERRWLAYNLLEAYYNNGKWATIPAFTVDHTSVWRQAAENAQRQNLNAIGRARQYALLLMALHPEAEFAPRHQCVSDREFYAQAATLTIPRGRRKDVLTAMGISSPSQLTAYNDTLLISDEVWQIADDENWSQAQLFGVPNSSSSEQENAHNTAQKQPKPQSQPPRSFVERVEKQFGDYVTRVDKLRERIRKDTKTDYSQLEPLIDKQIDELRKLKKQIKG
jgi:hypothetical protein